MIDDIFTLGLLSGVVANIPINILDYFLYRLGINKIFIWHISASAFVEKKDIKTSAGLFIGAINDYILAGFKGVTVSYLLYFTSPSFYLIKGVSVGLFFWLLFFGIILRSNIARKDPVEPTTNITHMTWHILLGGLSALLIILLGDVF
ncbi:hypothetical protein [Natranaerobius thermophilus]|uniref:Uncharacterized protein n=1 Tax=Natranaerobius thermophilus (strain ATCC BAA-1301 / DSM 18059 / JW/NM-WN-LF) TaxID=457570 RepID=B2A8I8_NATTJ|nr:hypothetical protein [Natranaerobius thermophilus]ACB85872.1 hypothetical protein Nther_2306 [Natranaerobius thermophilus JW/NM-WN-LF]